MTPQEKNKPVIAWVDHDSESVSRIISAVSKIKLSLTAERKRIGELFDFRSVIVAPPENPEDGQQLSNLATRAIEAINTTCAQDLGVVLVDLHFGADEYPDLIQVGCGLAANLSQSLFPTPVGVYTRFDLGLQHRASLSTHKFAVVLERIEDYFRGTSKVPSEFWLTLFQEIIDKGGETATRIPQILEGGDRHDFVRWAPGQPTSASPAFRKAAPKLAGLLLEGLEVPTEGVRLRQLGGGFSGSFVVKAEFLGTEVAFVVKIDETPEKLTRELDGYKRVFSTVQHRYFLPLVQTQRPLPVTLAEEWWGAFAMSFEPKARPLVDQVDLKPQLLASVYSRVWEECLLHLYGDVEPAELSQADIFPQDLLDKAAVGYEDLRRYRKRVGRLDGVCGSSVARAAAAFTGFPEVLPMQVPWCKRIHGDLNCRNVLYDETKGYFYLIDFPNVAPGCVATDAGKAEAERVLIMMDWASGQDCDFGRLKVWARLTQDLSESFELNTGEMSDREAKNALTSAIGIRDAYRNAASDVGNWKGAYRQHLLASVLPYVAYSDITVAKRFLALVWAGQLLEAAW